MHHVMMVVVMLHHAVMPHHMMPMFSLHMILFQVHFLVLHFVFGGSSDRREGDGRGQDKSGNELFQHGRSGSDGRSVSRTAGSRDIAAVGGSSR